MKRLELWLSAVIVALDQLSKALVVARIPLHDTVPLAAGWLNLTHVQNTGAAFGLLDGADFPFKRVVLAVVPALALVAIAVYAATLAVPQRLARVALALILGGAVGNLIGRLRDGYVVDFVDVYWREYHFWAFNVADSAITIGVILMMLDMLWQRRHVSPTV